MSSKKPTKKVEETTEKKPRVYKTKEERKAIIQGKIDNHQKAIDAAKAKFDATHDHHQGIIDTLKAKMERIDNPRRSAKPKKLTANSIIKMAEEAGMSKEDVLVKLGLAPATPAEEDAPQE